MKLSEFQAHSADKIQRWSKARIAESEDLFNDIVIEPDEPIIKRGKRVTIKVFPEWRTDGELFDVLVHCLADNEGWVWQNHGLELFSEDSNKKASFNHRGFCSFTELGPGQYSLKLIGKIIELRPKDYQPSTEDVGDFSTVKLAAMSDSESLDKTDYIEEENIEGTWVNENDGFQGDWAWARDGRLFVSIETTDINCANREFTFTLVNTDGKDEYSATMRFSESNKDNKCTADWSEIVRLEKPQEMKCVLTALYTP